MKLVRFGSAGAEKPGLADQTGTIRDLSAVVDDIADGVLAPQGLARLAARDAQTLPAIEGDLRFGPPVGRTRQFVAIGLNYSDHAAGTGMPIPGEPIIFTKAVSCIEGADDEVRTPRLATKMDWEVELGIVIGTRARYVNEDQALDHVAGYQVCDDLPARAFQMEPGTTSDRGKGCETFGPAAPWLVTKDEVGDVQELDMWLDGNGKRMQTGNTRTMIFDCAKPVSSISEFMVLLRGDIITTGTPPGVGMGVNPQVSLTEGDVIERGTAGLGQQRHRVTAGNA